MMASKTSYGAEIHRFCKNQALIPADMKNIGSNTPRAYAEYLEKHWSHDLPGFPGLTGEEICQHEADRIKYNFNLGFTAKDVLEMIRNGSVSTETLYAGNFFNYGTTPDGSSIKQYSYKEDKSWRIISGEKNGYRFALVKIEGSEPCYNNLCCMLSKPAPVVHTVVAKIDTVYVVICPPEKLLEIPDSGFDDFMSGFKTVKPAVSAVCGVRYIGSDRSHYEMRGGRWFNLSLGFWASNNQHIQPVPQLPVGGPGAGGGDNPGGGPGGGGGDNPGGGPGGNGGDNPGGGAPGAGWGH